LETSVPIDREKVLQAAQKYVDKKKYDRAIAEYQRIVQEDPTDARTLLKIGDLQARLQAYPEAIATYDRVGQHYAAQGFALKAIAVYKQIRELIRKHAPQLADRYGHIVPKLAEIYTQLGLTSDALSAYDEVASRYQKAGRDRDAIEIFRKMVELDSTNPLPHLRLAEACCRVQALDEAIDSFWTAAELLLNLQRRDDALKVIERILHFRADPRYARVAAELFLQRGTREDGLQALAKLQICFQADPRDLDTLGLLAQAFTVIGQENKSIEVYKEMARIAREQGRGDLFEQLLAHLRAVAPHDEQVRALQSLAPAGFSSERPSARSHSAVSVNDAEVELLEEPPGIEAPFELQRPAPSSLPGPGPRPFMASAPDVVIVDDDVEAAEELTTDPDAFDAKAHARKAVIDAESFRKLRLYGKAIEALRIALEIDPRSLDIRQKLRELMVESGDRDGAIGETITLAALYVERGEPQHAEPLLYEVLEIEPEHPAALEMIQQIIPGNYPAYQQGPADHRGYAQDHHAEGFDPEAPLPSYDLEEISASDAMAGEVIVPQALDAVDDPFGLAPQAQASLPSFPLGGDADDAEAPEDDDLMAGLGAASAARETLARPSMPRTAPLPAFADLDEVTHHVPSPIDAGLDDDDEIDSRTVALSSDNLEGIEDVLEEADFFASRGLWEDARAILYDQLARAPDHPLLVERLREVEDALANSGASKTIERSQLSAQSRHPVEDRAFDIAASLEALDDLEQAPEESASVGRGTFDSISQEVDVDQVFAKFKEGVRAQVSESDSATHYDLGVAYKEMGLLPDAISEFELAARDATRECMCFAMIGMIYLELEDLENATTGYKRALEATQKTVDQEMALYYDLGNVCEMKQETQDALYFFQKIARRDPGYRDVKDRIAALMPQRPPSPQPSRAVNDDDEFDRVFDELFESK
jgi:tetratricopeptide (TPR) repeat protein